MFSRRQEADGNKRRSHLGFSMIVTDTATGHSKTDPKPDLTPAAPIQDTVAPPCSGDRRIEPAAGSAIAKRGDRYLGGELPPWR
jgi:hypothetical protein